MSADIIVSYVDIVPASVAEEFEADLRRTGAHVLTEPRSTQPQAAVEWLIPTAIAVFITQRYLGTLLQEAAKEHYPTIKAALRRLVRHTTGKDRDIRVKAVAFPSQKIESSDAIVLSVYVELRSGRKAKFCFEHSVETPHVEHAVEAMVHLILQHQRQAAGDVLAQAEAASPPSRWAPIVIRFDSSTESWSVWLPNAAPGPKATDGAA